MDASNIAAMDDNDDSNRPQHNPENETSTFSSPPHPEAQVRPNTKTQLCHGGPSHWCIHFFDDTNKPTNEALLYTAFVTFFVFTIGQTVASFIANSEAMLGDSAAMLVDSFTYAFNLYAERRKVTSTRKKRLQLELIPPLISVVSLVGVTAYILSAALTELLDDDDDDSDDPNASIMAIFSSLNLLLDIFNIACFAKARHFLGFAVSDTSTSLDHMYDHHYRHANEDIESPRSSVHSKQYILKSELFPQDLIHVTSIKGDSSSQKYQYIAQEDDDETNNDIEFLPPKRNLSNASEDGSHIHAALPDDDELYIGTEEDSANLNMCSAYTHVFADTCRSIAVMVAAVIASARNDVESEDADAIAAIVVSVFILISLGPLVRGMIYTWTELQSLNHEDDVELINEELRYLEDTTTTGLADNESTLT